MSNLLLIESSSRNCSVAVSNENYILALREEASDQFVHSEKLHVFIKECMSESGLEYSDLDAVCVSKGPGSYTGLRIGVSAAKGICYPLEIPLIAVDSLTVIASQLFDTVEGIIVPIMDARRMEVYEAVFSNSGEELKPISAKVIDDSSYIELLENGPIHFVGDACQKVSEVIKHPNAKFHFDMEFPSTKQLKALCAKKFNERAFEDVAYFEPYYLKDFVVGKPKKLL